MIRSEQIQELLEVKEFITGEELESVDGATLSCR